MLPSTLPSALEALDRIHHGETYDLAGLDMSMPGMDGLALTEAIRQKRGLDELPIVMLTSLGQRLMLPAEQRAGLSAFLSKPIKASALFATLVRVLQARPGQGSSVQPPPAPPPEPASGPRLADRLPLRVLVAEDNPINQRVALRLLERLGYRADLAANGLEVIEAVERQDYDLVLMDIQMPEMDGLEAARWMVRQRGPEGRPRIVAMTANALPGDRETALGAGIDAHLAKPIDPEQLASVLIQAALRSQAAGDLPPPLDALRLEHLRAMQGDSQPTLVRDLIELFLNDSALHLRRMAQAHGDGQAEQLRALAHRFLSATQNIGAPRLSGLCEQIELAARAQSLHAVQALLTEMAIERERVHAALAVLRPQD